MMDTGSKKGRQKVERTRSAGVSVIFQMPQAGNLDWVNEYVLQKRKCAT